MAGKASAMHADAAMPKFGEIIALDVARYLPLPLSNTSIISREGLGLIALRNARMVLLDHVV